MKKNQIELVVFDMAGTTVHDKGNVGEAFRKSFRDHGLEIPAEQVKKVMGYRKIDAIRMLLAENRFFNQEEISSKTNSIHTTFEQEMIRFYESDPTLHALPFAEESFAWLNEHSIQVALNTGFTRSITSVIIRKLNWNRHPHIQCILSSDEVPEGRPQPFMIRAIMKQLGIQDPAHVVKVGDTEVDIKEGRNASCGLVIAVTTGAYTREQLQQFSPDEILDSLSTLRNIIS